jgi:hypothetical protein
MVVLPLGVTYQGCGAVTRRRIHFAGGIDDQTKNEEGY